jgi:hypothetical protein
MISSSELTEREAKGQRCANAKLSQRRGSPQRTWLANNLVSSIFLEQFLLHVGWTTVHFQWVIRQLDSQQLCGDVTEDLMPHSFSDTQKIQESIRNRWGTIDWDRHFPWWRRPAKVRILLYADGSVRFDGGPFHGLQYVYSLLKTRAYYYVDFSIDFAHRTGGDATATIPGARLLTDAQLDIMTKYDEIWFFGIDSTANLQAPEIALLNQFVAAPKFGGVLVTGDHANLGRGIAGQVPRAGAMRQYPAPDAVEPGWNTTLEEGPDPNSTFDFEEQSDDRPQTIRYKRYTVAPFVSLMRRYRPHPVFCGPDGPIDVLPDHQHEGEALAPIPNAGDATWPTKAGYQEAPEIIAWGRIKDPNASKHGNEIGLISAYNGHNVDVGRIIADSTWHHWFDINVIGDAAFPSPYAGFDETPAGRAALKKIDAYFLNTGVWLAPPARQSEMRNAAWWSIVWSDKIVELSPKVPLAYLGEQALDALGRRAPRCTVSEWILDWPIFQEKIPRWEWPMLFDRFQLIDIPFERYVAGGILRRLLREVGPHNAKLSFPDRPVSDEQLEKAMLSGVEDGLDSLNRQLLEEAALISKVAQKGFRLDGLIERVKEEAEETMPA